MFHANIFYHLYVNSVHQNGISLTGQNVEGRWNDIFERCRPHLDDHLLAFNDLHILMACLGSNQQETTDKMMESIDNFIRYNTSILQCTRWWW